MLKSIVSLLLGLSFIACSSEHENLIEKAQEESLEGKAQLAKYLYLRVIEKHKAKDDIRYRALKGLAEVSKTQLFDYFTAARAYDKIFDEYGKEQGREEELFEMRLQASVIWRVNLERPQKALDVLSPVMNSKRFSTAMGQEIGRVYLALGQYEQAEHWLMQAWDRAKKAKSCKYLGDLQLELIQVFSLQDQCDEALKWSKEKIPESCERDEFAVQVEQAHCYEMTDQFTKAMQIFEELVKENPKNMRAHFFLETLKKRQRDKERK